MSATQLTAEIMALPLPERANLAKTIWLSLSEGLPHDTEQSSISDAFRRDKELSSGLVIERDYDEALANARKAISCA